MHQSGRKPKLLKDYTPPDYLIEEVELDVALDPKATRVASKLRLRPHPKMATGGRPLVLDGEGLTLQSLALNGKPLSPQDYELKGGSLIASVPAQPFTLEIVTLCDPDANTALSGLYRSRGTYCTQCEPEGFRRITYFIDRPDVLAVYTVRIEADRATTPVLLSNGNPTAHGDIPGTGRHFAIWHDPFPKPSYLFALVGGDLACVPDSFVTASGRKVALAIYVEPGKEDRCAWAMESLKRAMRWDEERFGREYDLEMFNIVAVSDFNMGAMENKGLNIFNDKLVLARPDTASDADYASIEGVIAHEFHNWTGDRVTCRDWFQLCLKEGLTVFRDQEFTGDTRSGPVERIAAVRMLKTHQFPEDAGPLAHPVRPASYIEINNFYTATVYEKGAEVCRMLQTLLGRDGFRKGLDLYFERHDGEAVTVEDFVEAMADVSGRDLSQFMLWYTQSGTPELACSLDYDAHAKTARLAVSQVVPPTPGQTKKEPMLIPLKVGLIGSNGDELPLQLDGGGPLSDGLLEVTAREQVFEFRDIPSPPTASLLRGFSAPVRLTTSLDAGQIEFLMMHDSDPFNRWQAAQTHAVNLLTAAARGGGLELARGKEAARLAHALGATASDASLLPSYRAEFLKLPSESDIARELARNVDTDAVHEARETLRAMIGNETRETLVELYELAAPSGSYSPDHESAGRRAQLDAALDLLVATGETSEIARAERHYREASNMTDAIAALSILSHLQGPARDELLAHFYARWQDEPLVLDKWFAVQARAAGPSSVETVRALLSHPKFSLKNPNRIRALIGSFAHANPTGFNRADGAGYQLLAGQALEIDRFNPHVAARLLGAFESWRILEPIRQDRAKAVLEDLAAKSLSTDSYEIVTKTLDAA
ncbi:MAG: aminopeptidase N [Methyloceanibacter sp.]